MQDLLGDYKCSTTSVSEKQLTLLKLTNHVSKNLETAHERLTHVQACVLQNKSCQLIVSRTLP